MHDVLAQNSVHDVLALVSYRIAVAKFDATIFLLVGRRFIQSYYDGESYGLVLSAGRIGMRNWSGLDATFRDFRVYHLVEDREKL